MHKNDVNNKNNETILNSDSLDLSINDNNNQHDTYIKKNFFKTYENKKNAQIDENSSKILKDK